MVRWVCFLFPLLYLYPLPCPTMLECWNYKKYSVTDGKIHFFLEFLVQKMFVELSHVRRVSCAYADATRAHTAISQFFF